MSLAWSYTVVVPGWRFTQPGLLDASRGPLPYDIGWARSFLRKGGGMQKHDKGKDVVRAVASGQPANWSRRKFGAAAASAAVVMSINSSPLRAATSAQCTVSGWVSANVSLHGEEPVSCGGRSPGYWRTQYYWPQPYQRGQCLESDGPNPSGRNPCSNGVDYEPGDTLFWDVDGQNLAFSGGGYGDDYWNNDENRPFSMLEVLYERQGSMGFHAVAALLNAAEGLIPVPAGPESGLPNVRDMFSAALNGQPYSHPSLSQELSPEDVQAFFESLYESSTASNWGLGNY